jgi:murein DD-endopeptidase MepM/ murein hydrolase activator NlpD/subtilase family serine protease
MSRSSPEPCTHRAPVRARPLANRRVCRLSFGLLTLAFLAVAAPASAAPDLVVDSLTVSPGSGPNGTTVRVTATIRNQGNAEAPASVTRVRINQSSTSVGPADDAICGSVATPVLAPGASAEVGCSPKIAARPAGANYIWAIADVNKSIGQVAVDNDRKSTLFTVDAGSADLVIDELVADPTDLANGDDLRVTATIRNQGEGPSLPSTTRIRLNENSDTLSSTDPVFCNIETPAVDDGDTIDVQCEKPLSGRPPGTTYVWAVADVNRAAGQSDTTNDRANTAIEVSDASSDLVVDSILVDPASAPASEEVTVTVAIRNQGSTTASSSVARIRINQNPDAVGGADFQICPDIQTSSISVGQTKTLTCKATLGDRPVGLNYIWAIADAGGTAGQFDRTNDRAKTEFVVEPPLVPDLVVRSITLNPVSAPADTQVTVTARIANEGEASSLASKTRILANTDPLAVLPTDTVLCDQVPTVALSPGASVQVSCKPLLVDRPYGINRVWAVADATAASGQTNTANDALSAAYEVLPPPASDLVVESLLLTPASAEPGREVQVAVRIRNQGTLAAAASTARVRINDSPSEVSTADTAICTALETPSLAAGAAADLSCTWTVTERAPGTAFVWAMADVNSSAGQIDRSNDNRSAALEVLVPDGPNLTVKRLVVRPNTARNGASVVVKARVFNKGNEAAPVSATTFRINQDPAGVGGGDQVLCEDVRTRAVAAGETVRVRCNAVLADRPVGPSWMWATADTSDTAGDVDPRDDSRRAAFTVADLTCSSNEPPVFEWPVEQPRVIQDYASYGSVPLALGKLGYHSGVDLLSHLAISAAQLPVYAAADGEVVALRKDCPSPASAVLNPPNGSCAGGWGNYVVVRHGADVFSVYAHLGTVFASKGCVEAGQRLALAGSSGSTSIPTHLHFGVMSELVEPVARAALGVEHYKRYHPLAGRVPEKADGTARIHLDPRAFMDRSRVRITQAVTASRGRPTGGPAAYLGANQEYVSFGELVPGYVAVDLPFTARPEDGAPYSDDLRYGWIPVSKIEVLATGLRPGSVTIDGFAVFEDEGAGANFVPLRESASASAATVTRAWGGQQLVPARAPTAGWQAVDVPGTSASGASGPREAWLETGSLAP